MIIEPASEIWEGLTGSRVDFGIVGKRSDYAAHAGGTTLCCLWPCGDQSLPYSLGPIVTHRRLWARGSPAVYAEARLPSPLRRVIVVFHRHLKISGAFRLQACRV